MEVHFPPELEQQLERSAEERHRNPEELVQEVVSHYFEEEAGSVAGSGEALKHGKEDLEPGEYLTREQRSNP